MSLPLQNNNPTTVTMVASNRHRLQQIQWTAIYVHWDTEQSNTGLHLSHSPPDDSCGQSLFCNSLVNFSSWHFSLSLYLSDLPWNFIAHTHVLSSTELYPEGQDAQVQRQELRWGTQLQEPTLVDGSTHPCRPHAYVECESPFPCLHVFSSYFPHTFVAMWLLNLFSLLLYPYSVHSLILTCMALHKVFRHALHTSISPLILITHGVSSLYNHSHRYLSSVAEILTKS